MILTVRTDKPEAEIGLFDTRGNRVAYETWQAHRQLAETIHTQLAETCRGQGIGMEDITGIVAYKGPGSFTGLRIGLTVANSLAYGMDIPIVSVGAVQDWIAEGIRRLNANENEKVALPDYGADAHITPPKK